MEMTDMARLINLKIALINREDRLNLFSFSDSDKGGISKIHLPIAISMHELTHPSQIFYVQGKKN